MRAHDLDGDVGVREPVLHPALEELRRHGHVADRGRAEEYVADALERVALAALALHHLPQRVLDVYPVPGVDNPERRMSRAVVLCA